RDIAQLVYESWYRLFGLPQSIVSDRDKLFTSHFWKELHRLLDIRIKMSTAAHPETDGSSERSNKTAIEALQNYVNRRQSDWMDHLIHVETAMNNSVNAITKMTPTQLLFGTSIRLFPSFGPGTIVFPQFPNSSSEATNLLPSLKTIIWQRRQCRHIMRISIGVLSRTTRWEIRSC